MPCTIYVSYQSAPQQYTSVVVHWGMHCVRVVLSGLRYTAQSGVKRTIIITAHTPVTEMTPADKGYNP